MIDFQSIRARNGIARAYDIGFSFVYVNTDGEGNQCECNALRVNVLRCSVMMDPSPQVIRNKCYGGVTLVTL